MTKKEFIKLIPANSPKQSLIKKGKMVIKKCKCGEVECMGWQFYMKPIIAISLFILIITSCESQNIPDICWECKSIVYGMDITDYYCSEYVTDVENYKARMMHFYDGGMTTIECVMIPDTVRSLK